MIGAILSLIGLVAAVVAAYRAKRAEAAAEEAKRETRVAMGRVLTTVELERSVALLQRIKSLNGEGRWELTLELYQPLRVMLRNIFSRYPDITPELEPQFERAIDEITFIEDRFMEAHLSEAEQPEIHQSNVILNSIQVYLEELAANIQFPKD